MSNCRHPCVEWLLNIVMINVQCQRACQIIWKQKWPRTFFRTGQLKWLLMKNELHISQDVMALVNEINTVHSSAKILPIMYQNHKHYKTRNVLFQRKEVENIRYLKKCQYIKYSGILNFNIFCLSYFSISSQWAFHDDLGFGQVVSFISHYLIFVICFYFFDIFPVILHHFASDI